MKPSTGSHTRLLVSASLLFFLSMLCGCSGQIQCGGRLLTRHPNGTVMFEPLPPGAGPVQPVYDPGPVGGWYDLANRFANAARPGGLPYGTCEELIS